MTEDTPHNAASSIGPEPSPGELGAGVGCMGALLEESLDAVIVLERDGTVLEWSRGAERIFGIPRETALAANLYELPVDLVIESPVGTPPMTLDLRQFVTGGPEAWCPTVGEVTVRRADGTSRFVQGHVFPVPKAGDGVLGAIVRDVTELRQTEKARQAMHDIAQAALTSAGLEDLGRCIHQVIGALMPAPNLYIALYDPATDMVSFPYYVDEAEPPSPPCRGGRGITEYILRTGTTVLADRNGLDNLISEGEICAPSGVPESYLGLPLAGPSGRPIGVLAVQSYDSSVVYSPSERALLEFVSNQVALVLQTRRAEEAVREERDFARSLVDTAQAFVLVLDLQGKVVTYNAYAEAVTGRPVESAVGLDWVDTFVPEREREEVRAVYRRALEEGLVSGHINHILGSGGADDSSNGTAPASPTSTARTPLSWLPATTSPSASSWKNSCCSRRSWRLSVAWLGVWHMISITSLPPSPATSNLPWTG